MFCCIYTCVVQFSRVNSVCEMCEKVGNVVMLEYSFIDCYGHVIRNCYKLYINVFSLCH